MSGWAPPSSSNVAVVLRSECDRLIGEQHVREDPGCIPPFADWVKAIRPEPWMGRALKLETGKRAGRFCD
jgi:hypothetical protein